MLIPLLSLFSSQVSRISQSSSNNSSNLILQFMQFENQIIGSINFFTPRPFDRYSIILPVLNRFYFSILFTDFSYPFISFNDLSYLHLFDLLFYSIIFHILPQYQSFILFCLEIFREISDGWPVNNCPG